MYHVFTAAVGPVVTEEVKSFETEQGIPVQLAEGWKPGLAEPSAPPVKYGVYDAIFECNPGEW